MASDFVALAVLESNVDELGCLVEAVGEKTQNLVLTECTALELLLTIY